MATFYERMQALVNRTFSVSGGKAQNGTLKQSVRSNSPSQQSSSPLFPDEHPIRLVVFRKVEKASNKRNEQERDIGEWTVLVDPTGLGVTIKSNDRIVCSEGTLTVITPGLISPGGVPLVYDLVCRK